VSFTEQKTNQPANPVSDDWRVEAVRTVRMWPIEVIKILAMMVYVAGIGWYALTKMDGHVDKLAARDVELKKQQDETVTKIFESGKAGSEKLGEQHLKAVTEIKDGFRDAADRNERLYERLMNRNGTVAVPKGQ